MVKVSIFLTRRSDLTHDEFIRYWRDEHAPFLLGLAEFHKYVRRYSQQHPQATPEGLPIAPYGGLAELWFDDVGAAWEAFSHETYATVVVADEERFLDRAKTVMMVTNESQIM